MSQLKQMRETQSLARSGVNNSVVSAFKVDPLNRTTGDCLAMLGAPSGSNSLNQTFSHALNNANNLSVVVSEQKRGGLKFKSNHASGEKKRKAGKS